MSDVEGEPAWDARGRTVTELIRELQSFEDPTMPVRLSVEVGDTLYLVGLVVRDGAACVLISYDAQA